MFFLQSEQAFLCCVEAKWEQVSETLLQARDVKNFGKKERESDDRWQRGVNTACKSGISGLIRCTVACIEVQVRMQICLSCSMLYKILNYSVQNESAV